jgi:hypothetical protein
MNQTVQIPGDLLQEADQAARDAGFPSTDEFITWVLADKLRELRKGLFYDITDRVKSGLAERGITPEEVLEDFEQFRRS